MRYLTFLLLIVALACNLFTVLTIGLRGPAWMQLVSVAMVPLCVGILWWVRRILWAPADS